MATNNSWNSSILSENTVLNGGVVTIGDDGTSNTINIGTSASSGRTIIIGNSTGSSFVNLSTGSGGINIGTSANSHTSTFGSTHSTSSTNIYSGSGALNITATNGPLVINSGTGTQSYCTNGSTETVNIFTGAGIKTNTIGSTSGSSSTKLQYGTGNFILASATGTVMSGNHSGYMNYPLQPAFFGYLGTTDTSATGNGGTYTLGGGNALTKVFDQSSSFTTAGVFTAPITGNYCLTCSLNLGAVTIATSFVLNLVTTYTTYSFKATQAAGVTSMSSRCYITALMDSGDTAKVQGIANGESSNSDSIISSISSNFVSFFGGYLEC
jgi:fibronectin-binding autotransporter adhesin